MLRIIALLLLLPAFSGCISFLENDNATAPIDLGTSPPPAGDPSQSDHLTQPSEPSSTNQTVVNATGNHTLPANYTIQPWVWPNINDATIRPGVQMRSDGGQCTSNFVFLDPYNTTVYLGFAAHCVGGGDSSDTNGCTDNVNPAPIGTKIDVEGANKPAVLVYSSWTAMRKIGESSSEICAVNDFALVALHPDDAPLAHPAMLTFGGPTQLATSVSLGDKVLTFGNTGLRPGPSQLDAREGYVSSSGVWSTTIYAVTPGLPGDSGSGVLTADGAALGLLVTVSLTGSNGVTNLQKAMDYAGTYGVPLELGTWAQLSSGSLPET